MQSTLKLDTLAYQLGERPLVKKYDMRHVPLGNVIKSLNTFMNNKDVQSSIGGTVYEAVVGNPEQDALIFYMLNHAVSLVRSQVDPLSSLGNYQEILDEYHEQLAVRATRMFFYLLLICTRESRHDKNSHNEKYWADMKAKYGQAIYNFHKEIKGGGSDHAASTLRNNEPDTTLGNYCEFLSEIFHTGSYHGGYGGKAWAAVADCLKAYVLGDTSAEMMLDTSFTLCHNNGPIFNKGMLYTGYSSDIYKILDVQRSGQIPQLVATKGVTEAKATKVVNAYKLCHDILGAPFTGYVDWFQVELLGALKSYTHEQKKQVEEHGHPANLKAKQEAEAIKKQVHVAKKVEAENKKMAEQSLNFFEVMPNVLVKKVKVERND